MRRAVITGTGLITCAGVGTDPTWEAVRAGRGGIGPIESFDTSAFRTHIGGEVRGFEATEYVSRKKVRQMDRFAQYAVAATRMAVEESGIAIEGPFADRVAVVVSSGIGGISTIHRFARVVDGHDQGRVSPFFLPMVLVNLAAGHVAIETGAKGPIFSPVSACSTGVHSIGEGLELIRHGRADAVIAGGSEAALCTLGLASFDAMRALSTRNDEPERASRPFDRDRDGFVMSDGAGIVVLEERERALERGATILGEIAGWGMSGDAHHVTSPAPEGEGAVRCMRSALVDAGIEPTDVDYVNAHGTSTPINDPTETQAIKTVFGDHAHALAISSTKSMLGHSLGATGAVEAVLAALALREGVLPPTINLDNPDPACDLDYVPNAAREQEASVAISNSFGFGGTNATVVVRRHG